jgi:hypothetical protein
MRTPTRGLTSGCSTARVGIVARAALSLATLVMIAACGTPPGGGSGTSDDSSAGSTTAAGSSTSASAATGTTASDAESTGSPTSSGSSTAEASSSDGETTSGDPPKGDCGSANLLGCYRGMYLSLYSDGTGQIAFGGETEEHRFILGDADKEQLVLDFIEGNRIESLALYDMGTILDDDGLELALASFMTRAREAGVLRIEAIGATSTNTWDQIAEFHDAHAPFDGFVTEIEFWNEGATFDEFIGILEYVRAMPLVAPSGGAPTLSVYVGWLEPSEVEAMLPLIDRACVHVYVDQAPAAFGYGEERFEMFADANEAQGRDVEIWPIFSAEDHAWSAGAETFMGEWLTDNGLDAAELALLGDFEVAPVYGRIEVSGFQYFSYFFLERYLP